MTAKIIVNLVMLILSMFCIVSLGLHARRDIYNRGDDFEEVFWFAIKIAALLLCVAMFFFSSIFQPYLKVQ